MSKILLLSTIVTITLLLNGCSNGNEQNDSKDIKKANSILSTNEYVLTSLNKTQYVVKKEANGFVVEGAKNKVIILDVFATWCPPCKAEASHLTALQKKYKDELLIIGITVEEDIENAKLESFRSNYDANYILVNSEQNRPLINEIATSLNIGRNFGIPLMAMYKDGKLVSYYQGATEEEFIESDIKKALGK